MGYDYLVFAVGILAMAFSVFAFQLKRRFSIIICSSFGQSAWVLYFLLQADLVSAISCLITAVMLALFSKRGEWKFATGYVSMGAFVILLSAFSILTFSVWSDIFPLLAGIFAVIANSRPTEREVRFYSVFWCSFWLLNSAVKVYPVAFFNDLFTTVSTVVALIRYRDKEGTSDK